MKSRKNLYASKALTKESSEMTENRIKWW